MKIRFVSEPTGAEIDFYYFPHLRIPVLLFRCPKMAAVWCGIRKNRKSAPTPCPQRVTDRRQAPIPRPQRISIFDEVSIYYTDPIEKNDNFLTDCPC